MKYFCTLSDSRYLLQGLTMYNSLLKYHSKDEFTLYYLCLDLKTYEYLQKLNFINIIPIYEGHFIFDNLNKDVKKFKNKTNPELGGNNNNNYCWALASCFCRYLLKPGNIDHILYIDSDIYFYSSMDIVYDEIGDKSVGIIKHRHNTVGCIDGAYNVGIIYFKNDRTGNDCLQWWIDGVINDKYPEYATCGDQKFLEGFIPNFGEENVCVIDEKVGHGAPWNFRLYGYDKYNSEGKILYGDKEQVLVFNHFSRIRIKDLNKPWPENLLDFTGGNYPDHTLGFQVFNLPEVRKFYTDYVNEIRGINNVLNNKLS